LIILFYLILLENIDKQNHPNYENILYLKLGYFAFYLSTKLALLDLLKTPPDIFLYFDMLAVPNLFSIVPSI